MEECQITTPEREAAFLANVAHESGQLNRLIENLDYSAVGLCKTWPKRFTMPGDASGDVRLNAMAFAHSPEKIANVVYAERNGNGDERSGDGWRYRGRGPLMLTGKLVYQLASRRLGTPFSSVPDLMMQPLDGARASAWFFAEYKKLNGLADKGDIRGITKAINGGYLGLAERTAIYKTALRVLG